MAGGADSARIAVAFGDRSIIRIWKAEGSSDLTSESIGNVAGQGELALGGVLFSRCGSFLAARLLPYREPTVSTTLGPCMTLKA